MGKAGLGIVTALTLGLVLLLIFSASSAAYVAPDNGGVDPLPPPPTWNIDLVGEVSGGADAVHRENDLLYVAAGDKLLILDTAGAEGTGLTELREVGVFGVPSGVRDVTVAGRYAYVAAGHGGLLVVDVMDPASPTLAAATPGVGGSGGRGGPHDAVPRRPLSPGPGVPYTGGAARVGGQPGRTPCSTSTPWSASATSTSRSTSTATSSA